MSVDHVDLPPSLRIFDKNHEILGFGTTLKQIQDKFKTASLPSSAQAPAKLGWVAKLIVVVKGEGEAIPYQWRSLHIRSKLPRKPETLSKFCGGGCGWVGGGGGQTYNSDQPEA